MPEAARGESVTKSRAVVALLLLAYAGYGLLAFNRTERLVHDDVSVPALADRINKGQVPYRDFALPLTPGAYVVQGILHRAFGYELIVGRWYALGEHLLLFFLVWGASAMVMPPRPVTLWPLALLFFGPLFTHPFYSLDALVLSCTSLLLGLRYLDAGSRRSLYLAGAAASLSFLFKQNLGAATLLWLVVLWLRSRAAQPSLWLLALAVLAPLAPFGIYLFVTDSAWLFVANVFWWPMHAKGPPALSNLGAFFVPNRYGWVLLLGLGALWIGTRGSWRWRTACWTLLLLGFALTADRYALSETRIDGVALRLFAGVADLVMKVPAALCVLAGWRIMFGSRQAEDPRLAKLETLWLFSCLHLIAAAAAGATWYHFQLAFPFVYGLACWLFAEWCQASSPAVTARESMGHVRRHWAWRVAPPAGATALILYGLWVNLCFAAFGGRVDSQWRLNPVPALIAMREPAVPGLRGMRLSSEEGELLASISSFLASKTRATEEVFAFPMGMDIYVTTRRLSSSYYSHYYFEGIPPVDCNEKVIDYLQSRRPKYVVLSDVPEHASGAALDRVMSVRGQAREVWAYIKANFDEVARFKRYVVLESRLSRASRFRFQERGRARTTLA